MEERKKRIRRSKNEVVSAKISALEESIKGYEGKIAFAKKQIEELRNPPKQALKMKDVTAKIKELDLPLEDVMKAVEKISKK